MGIELLLVAQRLKVWLNGKRDDSRRAVGKVLFQSFGVHFGNRMGIYESCESEDTSTGGVRRAWRTGAR